jgi:hypothetical protein
MALVTLAVAHAHIRAAWTLATSPPDPRDADLQLKVDHASAIVLSEAKGTDVMISSLTSVGGVATLTTAMVHGLTTGDTVFIRGAVEPEYNGVVTVTVTGTTTFTYTVTGSPAGTATGPYALRIVPAWTSSTVPSKMQAAVLLMVTHLWEHRGDDMYADEDLWKAIRNVLGDLRHLAVA